MTVKAKLVILRHGRTRDNEDGLVAGRHDAPLTDMGEEQGLVAGRLFGDIRFDKVFGSDLQRSFNTAALALEGSNTHAHLQNEEGGWEIERSAKITEIDAGDFTGRHEATDPDYRAWERRYARPFPNGESEKQAVARLRDFFETEARPRLERGENVLVVAHAGIVRLFDVVLGIDEEPKAHDTPLFKDIPSASPFVHDFEDGVLTNTVLIRNPKAVAADGMIGGNKRKPRP